MKSYDLGVYICLGIVILGYLFFFCFFCVCQQTNSTIISAANISVVLSTLVYRAKIHSALKT